MAVRPEIKRFLLKVLLLTLPVLAVVAGVNLLADPANLFQGARYEAGIARLLVEGKNVADIGDYDDRLVQKYYVGHLTQAPDILVLGSSLTVWPAAGFPLQARRSGAHLVIVNRDPTDLDAYADLVIHDEIGPTLSEVVPANFPG